MNPFSPTDPPSPPPTPASPLAAPFQPLTPAVATPLTFECSICGEPSTDICTYCTKDACANHRCEICRRCSDCCDCDKQRRR